MIAEAKEGHPEISERDLRRMFSVSRSWYYERPRPQQRAYTDVELWNAKERIVLKFPGYGYHRVTKELQRRGWALNYKRVLRIMREESLLCQLKRRLVPATDSAHSFRSYPNLIKDVDLALGHNLHPTTHRLLLSGGGPGRLPPLLRVGWSLSRWIDTRLTLSAPETALWSRLPEPGLIHHSDQGRALRKQRVCSPAAERWRPHQHGRGRQPLRER